MNIGRVLAAAGLVLSFVSGVWAAPVLHTGHILNGFGGGAWSYIHEATSCEVGPDYRQNACGLVILALDPFSTFEYTFDDNDGNSVDDGDTLSINWVANLLEYSGDPFGTHSLGVAKGTISLFGTLTVGGLHSPGSASGAVSYTHGLSGTLGYTISFTGTPDRGIYVAGNTLSGTGHFQAANYSTVFNGIGLDTNPAPPDVGLEFALWGSNRGPTGVVGALFNGQPTSDEFGIDIVANGHPSTPVLVPGAPTLLVVGTCLVGLGVFRGGRARIARPPTPIRKS
jgi:hypothetical protein